jgi:hypothetical protein
VLRIRIRMDPHQIERKDPDPHQSDKLDPDPHQSDNGIRIRINLQKASQNVWNMSLFEHFFKVLSLFIEARIRIKVKGRLRIRTRIKVKSRIRIRIKEISRVGIRIKVMRIRDTAFCAVFFCFLKSGSSADTDPEHWVYRFEISL